MTFRDRSGRAGDEDEAGFIAAEWVAAVVFLLLPMVFLGAAVSRWPERQEVARAASAEAARAAVLSETEGEAVDNAQRVAQEVASNYGVSADQFSVDFSATGWDWGEEVTVTVTIVMPSLDIPGVGSWSATDWSSSTTHRIEDYRGLE